MAVWCLSKTNIILAINKKWRVQCKSKCPDKYKLASVWDAQVSCYCCIFIPSCSFTRDESSRVDSESWESRRDFDYDNFQTCSIFKHIEITVAACLDVIQVSRWDFIFGIMNSLEARWIIMPSAKLGKWLEYLFFFYNFFFNYKSVYLKSVNIQDYFRDQWFLYVCSGKQGNLEEGKWTAAWAKSYRAIC